MAKNLNNLEDIIKQLQSFNTSITEIQRSNAELDRFASIAAHDLKSPLVSLALCLGALDLDDLNADNKELILQANESIIQMGKLITDLLSYAHVGNSDLKKTSCNCNNAITRAIASMADTVHAKITHTLLPIIYADETLITQLFQNLLENSIKYCKDKPVIYITVQKSEKEWLFSVQDNGIGIPADRLEDIFKPFIRLHGEYPGSGLGLATCRRIIKRHNGQLWANSELGKGSTFFFTLPK